MRSSIERKIRGWIRAWERKGYADGIPDEAPANLEEMGRVPSYRLICYAILKGDHNLETLGFSRPPCELYNQLKRIEISMRGNSGKELY